MCGFETKSFRVYCLLNNRLSSSTTLSTFRQFKAEPESYKSVNTVCTSSQVEEKVNTNNAGTFSEQEIITGTNKNWTSLNV